MSGDNVDSSIIRLLCNELFPLAIYFGRQIIHHICPQQVQSTLPGALMYRGSTHAVHSILYREGLSGDVSLFSPVLYHLYHGVPFIGRVSPGPSTPFPVWCITV